MHRTRRAGRTALAAVIALGVVAVPAAAFTAPTLVGGAPSLVMAAESAGTLTLGATSSIGFVEWNERGLRQEFREENQCRIVPTEGSDNLLSIQGFLGSDPGSAGFRNGDIGVYERDDEGDGASNAAQCFRVDSGSFAATETLGLTLNGAVVKNEFGPLAASSIDVEVIAQARRGKIEVTLLNFDGSTTTLDPQTWRAQSGTAIDIDGLPASGTLVGIKLRALDGSFSVRGATFQLVAPVIDCLDVPVVLEGDGDGPAVTLRRLNNADPSEDCMPVPYTLRNGDQQVQFLKPLDEQISAQFILDIEWTVSPANTNWQGLNPLLPETEIDYEASNEEGTDFAPPVALRWCPDLEVDESGDPTGITNVLDSTAVVDQVGEGFLAGKQFTCLVSQNARVVDGGADDDYVTLAQQIYLLGDAVYRFK